MLWLLVIFFVLRCAVSIHEIISEFSIYALFGYAGEAISITTFLAVIYEKWLWKYDISNKMPRLYKNYKGSFVSSYDNKRRSAEITITQTLLTVNVNMTTKESHSTSMTATVTEILGEQKLIYTYNNVPDAKVRERSPIHYGTVILDCTNIEELTGSYFTDRKTTGDIHMKKVND
jgi:hypothetical protein